MSLQKRGEVRLEGAAYTRFKMQLHALDGWRCKVCRKILPLQVHHMIKRSERRLDIPENCISVCIRDHNDIESSVISVSWVDVEKRLIRIQRNMEER